ncbi:MULTISPECIES: HupE/UreJ family protein [Rhizobium]|uniref:Hydrogenase/urease accessory protein n=1 Tax=Rhizobium favelukesii TaxID=348824 RepID=W6RMY4_9HYPH|nr:MULTISPECIES: HupE/UreJ family protein [Rhizobium]MCA0804750.1 HupE/UreJ family protein [Rhizobium sp. T1473]MCS0458025.1 HupE/UreJ family protein [Rhizobium favelukesii]UFS79869.1 HupE/UreJ family protein [Rhizobium sp. T136]CDM61580.1 hydrogenase/urease accessory protein [Rhizobium favelukesii]
MFSKSIKLNVLLAAAALAPSLAFAHTGVGQTVGFLHGFSHPVSGLDHVLAMVLVGLIAWQIGGRALWLVPLTFVSVMAIGSALGMMRIALPFVEAGIALSVIVLGAVVALGIQAPVAIAAGVVGLFAIFHGHAHGSEMPAAAGGVAYAAGFMLATAALHLAGIGLGYLIGKVSEQRGAVVARSAGGIAALAGIALLTGLV